MRDETRARAGGLWPPGRTASSSTGSGGGPGVRSGDRYRDRQRDRECAACTRATLYRDPTTHRLGEVLDDGQSEELHVDGVEIEATSNSLSPSP